MFSDTCESGDGGSIVVGVADAGAVVGLDLGGVVIGVGIVVFASVVVVALLWWWL